MGQRVERVDVGGVTADLADVRLRATLDSLLDPHVILTAIRAADGHIVDFRYDDVNEAACEDVHIAREDFLGQTLLDLFPNAADGLFGLLADVVETGVPVVLDAAPFENNQLGQWRFYDVRGVRLDDSVVVTMRDVTDRHEASRQLAQSEERYRLLAENAWDCIWTMEIDGTISYISPSVERMRGITPAEAAVQTLDQIHTPDSAAQVGQYFADLYAAMAAGTVPPIYHGEREYYRKDGSIMFGELQVIPQVDADGRVVRILGVTRDISERRSYEEQLARLAITDPLTGVLNRRHGEQIFTADLAEARRYGPPLTMLMVDIDHFKAVNDTHGHQVGDEVLTELTRRLTANLRPSDVLARWGGDEFVIVMRHCAIADGLIVAEKLRDLVAGAPFDNVGQATVSIGAAELKADDDLASWLARTDAAMYTAKSTGRNAVSAGVA